MAIPKANQPGSPQGPEDKPADEPIPIRELEALVRSKRDIIPVTLKDLASKVRDHDKRWDWNGEESILTAIWEANPEFVAEHPMAWLLKEPTDDLASDQEAACMIVATVFEREGRKLGRPNVRPKEILRLVSFERGDAAGFYSDAFRVFYGRLTPRIVRACMTTVEAMTSPRDGGPSRKRQKREPAGIPAVDDRSMERRFKFEHGQAFFDGEPLPPLGGNAYDMLKKLVGRLGRVVPYKEFDKHYTSTSPGMVYKSKHQIVTALAAHEVPCEITTITGEGYMLSGPARTTKGKKRVRKR